MADLPPGPELDALVAEKWMGFTRIDAKTMECNKRRYSLEGTSQVGSMPTTQLPHYSTDIAAAWEVVEKLEGLPGWTIDINPKGVYVHYEDRDAAIRADAEAKTAAHAICLAAQAVGGA